MDKHIKKTDNSVKNNTKGDRVHHKLTRDGKARLLRFVKDYAIHEDFEGVINVLKAIRFYMCLLPLNTATSKIRLKR